MESLSGRTIGNYEIVAELGRGGMAIVYKAHQRNLGRMVALKVLPLQFAFDKEFVSRFFVEARAAAKLNHPNIVTIHDVGEVDGVYYIVQELLEGITLSEWIDQNGALSPERAANLVRQIASALDYAHARGFLHRDVKPSNVMVSPHDHATLMDFGIVKAVNETRITKSGSLIGTPAYMSPEQIRGEVVDARADLYALGIVAYEMLSGHVPFEGDTARVLYAQVNETPRPLRSMNPRVTWQMEMATERALAKEPAQRFNSAGEFANALTAATTQPANRVAPSSAPTQLPERIAPRRAQGTNAQSNRWLWFGGAAGIIILFLVAVVLLQNRDSENSAATSAALTQETSANETPTEETSARDTPAEEPTPESTDSVNPSETALPAAGDVQTFGTDNADMVFVPEGEFTMGSRDKDSDASRDEKPAHQVALDAFWIDRFEVTNARYKLCVDAGNCQPPSETKSSSRDSYFDNSDFDEYPVLYVSWDDAQAYCAWAEKRLPTEAEWEKAARGGDERIYPWGSEFEQSNVNSGNVVGDTTQIGSYESGASAYGAKDMAGNVWEWVADWYDENYYLQLARASDSAAQNPTGPDAGQFRVLRGGSFPSDTANVRAANRDWDEPAKRFDGVGFRCVR